MPPRAVHPIDDLAFSERSLDPRIATMVAVVGVAVGYASAYWLLRYPTFIGDWRLRRRARREIKSRPYALVDPDDPGAIFVDIIPRENWRRIMLDNATDVGFLLVDERGHEILFEGDRERIRIPADAIMTCKVEWTWVPAGAVRCFFTVIRAENGPGIVELPFAFRGDMGRLGNDLRQQRAEDLRDRIWAISSE